MNQQKKYYVTYVVDFTRTRGIRADSKEEAIRIAVEKEATCQSYMKRSGYIIGDVDVVDAGLNGEVSSDWKYRSGD